MKLQIELCADRPEGGCYQMAPDVLQHLLKEYIPAADEVVLGGRGEPLLYPWFMQTLARIGHANPRCPITIHTDGVYLTSTMTPFFRCLPNHITVDIETTSSAYDSALGAGIRDAIFTEGGVQYHLTLRVTPPADQLYADFWKHSWSDFAKRSCNLKGVTVLMPSVAKIVVCPVADAPAVYVSASGAVLPCFEVADNDASFGHVLTDPRSLILTRALEHYEILRSGDKPHPLCEGCLEGGVK